MRVFADTFVDQSGPFLRAGKVAGRTACRVQPSAWPAFAAFWLAHNELDPPTWACDAGAARPTTPGGGKRTNSNQAPRSTCANSSRVRATSASVSGCERLEPDSTATARDDEPQHATGRALVARRHERPNVGVAVAAMRGVSPDQAQRSEVAGRANRQHRRQASRASATRAWIGRNRRARLSMSRARSTPDAHIKPEAPWPHRPPPASHSKRPSRQRHDHRCPLDKPHPISAFPRR
jgi:hypothetical protein